MRRLFKFASALALLGALIVSAPHAATAGGDLRYDDAPSRSHYYYTRDRHYYYDPYAYEYEPRGYYPYYNSGYWIPRRHYRRPYYGQVLPPYYQAWGYPKRRYYHREWHARRHGRHRHHHW